MNFRNYPRFLLELLDSCPDAGTGVHPWLFRVARYLHRYHTPEEIYNILENRVANCGRYVEAHEITDAVKNSGPCAWEPSEKTAHERRMEWLQNPVSRRVPKFDPQSARSKAEHVPIQINDEWLKTESLLPTDCSTGVYLEQITEPGEKVLVFSRYKSQGSLYPDEIKSIDAFSQKQWPEGAWFLCNPVDGKYHFNCRLAKDSRRSAESVTAWRYAVLECDLAPKEIWRPIWLKILIQLELPIVSIVSSGDRGDHALVRVDCATKGAWDQFKLEKLRPLVALGADDGALSAVRLTRLANCWRGERRQELLYLNPKADGSPIFKSLKSL